MEDGLKLLTLIIAFIFSINIYAISGCDIAEIGIASAADIFESEFGCKNTEVVTTDLKKVSGFTKYCSANDESYLKTKVSCTVLSKTAGILVSENMPEKWDCSEDTTKEYVSKLVLAACNKITK
jgi:hypothetical protein